ncbi:MAG: DUF4105 domain-containing protein [Fibromonadaceae bacterium]|nr:DUF4105 domain-containing protein [Fibromonadaceae bacterium]
MLNFYSTLFIVLTSPYQQNPASAFGHVFLLQADSLPYPLWNTIEFVAEPGDANKLSYITKGVYGGFAAKYETIPFYEKIYKYVDNEKRDLFIYPLKISNAELAKFNDTLNSWKTKEDSYKFFTKNCVDGLYDLLENTLDSVQEAPALLTPQNLIRLLNESGKLEKPILLQFSGNKREDENFIEQKDMQIPHKYSRFDIGMLFLEKVYANLRFRLFLHDVSDYAGYYSNFINLEVLVLNMYIDKGEINFRELWLARARSEIPSRDFISGWSWLLERGWEKYITTNIGLGKTYIIFNDYLLGYMLRGSVLEKEQMEFYTGFQIFTRVFSARNYRSGIYFDYLRLNAKEKIAKTDLKTWISFDLREDLNLFAESSIKNRNESYFSIMLRFYWGI